MHFIIHFFEHFLPKKNHKTLVAIGCDFIITGICFYASLAIRQGSLSTALPPHSTSLFLLIPLVMLIQSSTLHFMGVYRGVWKYSSTFDLVQLIKACSLAVGFSLTTLFLSNRLINIPRTTFIIDWLLLIVCLGGIRFLYRLQKDIYSQRKAQVFEKLIIVGAGDLGILLLQEIRKSPEQKINPIGFIDNAVELHRKSINGIPVLGGLEQLEEIIERHSPQKFILP